MQGALQKAHEMVANLSSDIYKSYLSELAARGATATTDVPSRTVKTSAFDIVLPQYITVDQRLKELQQERRDMLLEYMHICNRLVFEDKNDVNLQESYAVIANRLTGVQQKIVTIERYMQLISDDNDDIVVYAMETLPYMQSNKRAPPKRKVNKPMGGGGLSFELIDRVKTILKTQFAEKIEPF